MSVELPKRSLMRRSCYRLGTFAPTLLTLAVLLLSEPASALQLYTHVGRSGANAVANHADSIASANSGGSAASDSATNAAAGNAVFAPSGEKGSGLSGKVFARFVMPEDWISLASLPGGAAVSNASIQGPPASASETVFTMRSFGQKVRVWLNGYRPGCWPVGGGRSGS